MHTHTCTCIRVLVLLLSIILHFYLHAQAHVLMYSYMYPHVDQQRLNSSAQTVNRVVHALVNLRLTFYGASKMKLKNCQTDIESLNRSLAVFILSISVKLFTQKFIHMLYYVIFSILCLRLALRSNTLKMQVPPTTVYIPDLIIFIQQRLWSKKRLHLKLKRLKIR